MRNRTPFKIAAAALAGFGLTACVNLSPDIVYPIGSSATLDPAYLSKANLADAGSISTAKSGDLLIRQGVQNAVVFVLENDVLPEGNISLAVQERKLNLTEGEMFYGAVSLGQRPALVACSQARPATVIPRLNPGAQGSGKICFELELLEGKIESKTSFTLDEETYASDQFFFVADGVYAITGEASSYQKLARWDPQFIYNVTPQAELRRTTDPMSADKTPPELGLRYIYANDKAKLEPVYVADDLPTETRKAPIEIDLTQDFPTIIEFDGAKIEILAIKDGVLAYRLLAGFDTTSTFIMDLPE